MDDQLTIQQATAVVERYRRRQSRSPAPEQRMQAFKILQNQSMKTLAANPEAVAAFHRRMFRQRRQSNVRQFEAIMKRPVRDGRAISATTSILADSSAPPKISVSCSSEPK